MELAVHRASGRLLVRADAYAAEHPHACFGHMTAWREAIWNAYRLPTLPFVATRGGAIVGVAPWTLMLSPLVGPYLVIAPFASYGDLLADDDDVRKALLGATHQFGRKLGIMYAQVRSRYAVARLGELRGVVDVDRWHIGHLPLARDADVVWSRCVHGNTRNRVRRARRLAVRIEEDPSTESVASVYASGMHSLGSPTHGPVFFRALAADWGTHAHSWLARTQDGVPAAMAIAVRFRDTLHYVFGANVHSLRPTCANSLLIWTMIERACGMGLAAVDFGRGEDLSGAPSFKRKWGVEQLPMSETVMLIWKRRAPNLYPTNPNFRHVQRIWSRLPRPATDRLSPFLIRGLG